MALVFPSSSNRPLLFKAHACTGGISVINVRQIHWLRGKISLKCCREQKAAFLSVGSVNVVVLLPLLTIILVEMFKWYVLSRGLCIPELWYKRSGSIRLKNRDRRWDCWLREKDYFEALCSHGQVHPFGMFQSFQCDLLADSIFCHLFIIKVHIGCSALLHCAHFPPALYHFMNWHKAGFTHSCVLLPCNKGACFG